MRNIALISFLFATLLGFQSFAGELLKAETRKVCMVTNMIFPKDQIPVKVGAKTYYGCCENCKKTLSEDPNSRFAKDPISGKKVDKATAVIGALEDGSVLYFESEKTFKKYSQK